MKRISRLLSLLLVAVMVFGLMTVDVAAASYSTGPYTVSHASGVNVRSSASTSGRILGASAKNTSFTVTKVSKNWGYTTSIKTTKGTKAGWVCLDYCKKTSPSSTSSAAAISFPKTPFPSSIVKGKGQHLSGTISSNQIISSISAVVSDSRGRSVLSKTVSPNIKSYALYDSSLDWGLSFGNLSAGNYTLVLSVKSGSTAKSISCPFTVKSSNVPTTPAPSSKASNVSTPSVYPSMKSYNKDFDVVNGFSAKYCYDQMKYQNYYGRVGCTAVSCSIVLSIAGKGIDPATYYKKGGWKNSQCQWTFMNKTATKNASGKTAVFKMLASELTKGKAVAFWANERHMVAVVGIRKNADQDHLKASDLLIIDPGRCGAVTTLDKAAYGYQLTNYKYYTAS